MKKIALFATAALLFGGLAFANADKGKKKKKCAKSTSCCQKKTSCNKTADEKTAEVKP
ncbi:MAG: hypothetical protein ACKO5C_03490 [Ferruginibacter sp.]|jgi:hypothetical protein